MGSVDCTQGVDGVLTPSLRLDCGTAGGGVRQVGFELLVGSAQSAGEGVSLAFDVSTAVVVGTYSFQELGLCVSSYPSQPADASPPTADDGGGGEGGLDGGGNSPCTAIEGTIVVETSATTDCQPAMANGGAAPQTICSIDFAATLNISATPDAAANVSGVFKIQYQQAVEQTACAP
jgi:hypothetical protein